MNLHYRTRMASLVVFVIMLGAVAVGACAPSAVSPTETGVEATVAVETQAVEQEASGDIRLEDGLGRTVTLDGPAQKVVSMAPSNTEILFAIGAGSQVVGRDEFSDFPEEAKGLPSIGGSFGEYNSEAIVALQPDLVLAAEINTPEQVQALQDLGQTVFYLSNPTDIEGMYANLEIVANLTGREAEAAQLIESLKARVAKLDSQVAGVQEKPLVFYELDSSDPNAPFTAGPGTFVDLLIERAGGVNLGSSLEGQWAQVSAEELLVQDPDLILLGDALFGVTIESVKARPGWEGLSAVQNDRIYPFDDNLVSRPGPRLVEGLEKLFEIIHGSEG